MLAQSFGIEAYRIDRAWSFVEIFSNAHKKPWIKILDCAFVYPRKVGNDE
jgi:hypothetical protein